MPSHQPFVFLDPQGRRWPRFRKVIILLGVMVFWAVVVFTQSLLSTPSLILPMSVRHLKGQLKALKNLQQTSPQQPVAGTQGFKHFLKSRPAKGLKRVGPASSRPQQEIRAGFYVESDAYSFESLGKNASRLTHVCMEWMSVVDGEGQIVYQRDSAVVDLARKRGLAFFPTLNNLSGEDWQPEAIENLANGPQERRDRFFNAILGELDDTKAAGLIIDWENLDPTYQSEITSLIQQLAEKLHAQKLQLWLTVSIGDDAKAFDFDALPAVVDHFLASLSDENAEGDEPGPVASQDWVESCLNDLNEYGNSSQWIAVLGNYGYDWSDAGKTAERITFPEAMSRASYAGVDDVEIKAPHYNPTFSYYEGAAEHTVWFLDGATFLNDLRMVREKKWGGFAINSLGSEDPAIWTALSFPNTPTAQDLMRMEVLPSGDVVTNVGRGEIVSVDQTQEAGKRTFSQKADGYFTSKYVDFPTFPVLYHQGGIDPKMVTFTFDDGPDPTWTPKILDILKAKGIKATFFLVGSQAEKYPGLVKRILAEGHNIGSHTYTHANLGIVSRRQVELELNATQRLIQSITGHSTSLFRPPYNADSQPTNTDELVPLGIAGEMGYLIVMENIDPEDWARPGVETIVNRVRQNRRLGNIILLHDAGGDRSETVEALPQIIDYLQQRGDQIVSLEKLLNMTRDDLMPTVIGQKEGMSLYISGLGFEVIRWGTQFLWSFLIVATVLVGLRTILVAYLASRHRPQVASGADHFHPAVSVIIAAYNEEKVIEATLRSVLDSDYSGELEVLVINDGSKDDTSRVIRELQAGEPRVKLIEQTNAGKSIALQKGLATASHEIIVFLDADTHFERGTIRHLVMPLADEDVGGVSGHAKVGNLRSFIARCQSLEYICGFNLDRRAYAHWNCITVAPGAISAFRKSVIEEVGGLSTDTLAEDTDLTLMLHRSDWKIDYASAAVAWTEAPETYRTLTKQRFRWAFGTLQCLWKHRDLVFNPRFKALGLLALPSIWFFQIILVAITPLVDFYLLLSIYLGNAEVVLPYVLFFIFTDVILAAIACKMEGESVWKSWRAIPMRFIYRPLLSWVIWKSIYQALRGVVIGWGKLERTASVSIKRPT